MPLKRKILTHPIQLPSPKFSYLSDAPQAVPHAAGFASELSDAPHAVPHAAGFASELSDAPHAVPHAAGFSSALSDAPHAVPHAAAVFALSSLFHPKMFDNAIFVTSCDLVVMGYLPVAPLG